MTGAASIVADVRRTVNLTCLSISTTRQRFGQPRRLPAGSPARISIPLLGWCPAGAGSCN
jgi:hypothetical protein